MTAIGKPLCIIPARGNSKRLPGKNIIPLGDKPLIAWAIEAARKADIFEKIWVSSEDEEILRTAKAWGARPLNRSPEWAGDDVGVVNVCLNHINEFIEAGEEYSALYVMLPTSPFRKPETIRNAWNTFLEKDADVLMSVVPLEHPPQWTLTQIEGGWLSPMYPDQYETLRQYLKPAYRHDGGHIITKITRFLHTKGLFGEKTLAYPVASEEAVDINEPIDLAWAEFLLQHGKVAL